MLLYLLRKYPGQPVENRSGKRSETIQNKGKSTKCPLCGSELSGKKRVKSVLFPGKPDSMMEISGCPYCFPVNPEIIRRCPVCKKEVPSDGHVIARVFIKPNKKHVHVLGCTGCYKRRV